VTNSVSYPNPNAAATAFVKPEIRDDPAIYPPAEVRRRFHVDTAAARDYQRARTRAWTRIKSGC
jgi:putrescine transport system substrate-binding protein